VLRSRYVREVATTLSSRGAALGVQVLTASITARWLGPEGKGMVALIILLPNMLSLFLNAGIGVGNAYYVGRGRVTAREATGNSIVFGLVASALGVAVMAGLTAFGLLEAIVPGVPLPYIFLGMIALPLLIFNVILGYVLYGLRRIDVSNVLNFIQTALVLPLMAVFVVWLKMGVLGAVIAQLTTMATVLTLTLFYLRREGCTFWPRWDATTGRLAMVYGVKGYLANLLQYFNYRLDTFFVNFFVGAAGVGIYGVAVSVAELLWQFPCAAAYVLFPKSAASDHETMNRLTPRVFWIVFGVTALSGVAMAIIARPLIRLVFSDAFLPSYAPCLMLLPGVVLLGAARVLTSDIGGRGYVHYNTFGSGITLVVTVIFDVLLIPRMGVMGAALASTISYTVNFLVSVAFYLAVSRSRPKDLPQVDVINVDCT
jgi:O-antigen/teichoic acid export membrane protein